MKKPNGAAWYVAAPTRRVTLAIKALAEGNANEGQQKLALEWILKVPCAMDDWAFRPDERETNIALGRQLVGHAILKEVKIDVSKLKEE